MKTALVRSFLTLKIQNPPNAQPQQSSPSPNITTSDNDNNNNDNNRSTTPPRFSMKRGFEAKLFLIYLYSQHFTSTQKITISSTLCQVQNCTCEEEFF